uniref:C2H2-type domain-containing protein n=1 Tax=Octopus bimaculoides TaxID=37653 RepID=A0A0L8G7F3_OCTBM
MNAATITTTSITSSSSTSSSSSSSSFSSSSSSSSSSTSSTSTKIDPNNSSTSSTEQTVTSSTTSLSVPTSTGKANNNNNINTNNNNTTTANNNSNNNNNTSTSTNLCTTTTLATTTSSSTSTSLEPNSEIYCKICDACFNSPKQATQHYQGKNHAKKMRTAEAAAKLAEAVGTGTITESGNVFMCALCSVHVTSQEQLSSHLNGAKHKAKQRMLDRQNSSKDKDSSSSASRNFQGTKCFYGVGRGGANFRRGFRGSGPRGERNILVNFTFNYFILLS